MTRCITFGLINKLWELGKRLKLPVTKLLGLFDCSNIFGRSECFRGWNQQIFGFLTL